MKIQARARHRGPVTVDDVVPWSSGKLRQRELETRESSYTDSHDNEVEIVWTLEARATQQYRFLRDQLPWRCQTFDALHCHHVVPSTVRPANLMKVLTLDANALQDPTPVEARVRREVAQRKLRHEKMNAERKLTNEQRREKLEAKKADEEKKGI